MISREKRGWALYKVLFLEKRINDKVKVKYIRTFVKRVYLLEREKKNREEKKYKFYFNYCFVFFI
jgi:hypothetical protein